MDEILIPAEILDYTFGFDPSTGMPKMNIYVREGKVYVGSLYFEPAEEPLIVKWAEEIRASLEKQKVTT